MRFFSDTSGSVAITAGLVAPMLAFTAVGVLDYGSAVNARSEAQRSLDKTVLSCASQKQCDADVFSEFFERSGVKTNGDPDVKLDYDGATGLATASAEIDVKSIVLGGAVSFITGSKDPFTTVVVKSAAQGPMATDTSEVNLDDHEVALVLDASDSMARQIPHLKKDATEFVADLFEYGTPKVSVVPFASVVRFPLNQGFEDILNTSSCPSGIDCTVVNWNGCFEMETMAQVAKTEQAAPYSMRFFPDSAFVNGARSKSRCPAIGNQALFFSKDRDQLTAKIDGLTVSNGTGTERALNWGYRAMKSEADSPYRDGVPQTTKTRSIILFSDGKPTIGGDRSGDRTNAKIKTLYDTLHEVCDAVNEDPDVELYVTYYQTGARQGGLDAAQLMRDCAVDASHFWLSNRDNLDETFAAIGALINAKARESSGSSNSVRLVAHPDA